VPPVLFAESTANSPRTRTFGRLSRSFAAVERRAHGVGVVQPRRQRLHRHENRTFAWHALSFNVLADVSAEPDRACKYCEQGDERAPTTRPRRDVLRATRRILRVSAFAAVRAAAGGGMSTAEPALWLPRPDVDALKAYFTGVTLQDVMQLRMPLFLAGERVWGHGKGGY